MLKKYIKNTLLFVSIIIGITNISAVFVFWYILREIEQKSIVKFDFSQYLAVQANQFSLLQIYLVLISISLALLAFYGFFHFKEVAEKVAEKKALEIAKQMVEQYLKSQSGVNLGNPSFPDYKNDGI